MIFAISVSPIFELEAGAFELAVVEVVAVVPLFGGRGPSSGIERRPWEILQRLVVEKRVRVENYVNLVHRPTLAR